MWCWVQTRNTRRSDKLWRWHVNHTAQAGQKLIYTEPDEAFHLKLTHTRRRKHLLVYGISETTKYLLYLPALEPKGEDSCKIQLCLWQPVSSERNSACHANLVCSNSKDIMVQIPVVNEAVWLNDVAPL